jgi:hypothetical protein
MRTRISIFMISILLAVLVSPASAQNYNVFVMPTSPWNTVPAPAYPGAADVLGNALGNAFNDYQGARIRQQEIEMNEIRLRQLKTAQDAQDAAATSEVAQPSPEKPSRLRSCAHRAKTWEAIVACGRQ